MSRQAGVLALFLAMAFCGATVAWAALGDSGPSIASDLADYNPGQTVTLTGSGWDTGGTQVHIVVNDDVGQTWSHVADVTPDGGGSLTATFPLPPFFLAPHSGAAAPTPETPTPPPTPALTAPPPPATPPPRPNDPTPPPPPARPTP